MPVTKAAKAAAIEPAPAAASSILPGLEGPRPPPDEVPAIRAYTDWRSDIDAPLARVGEARAAKLEVVERLFAGAGVAFPPAQMLLRGFKQERVLELWAASRHGDRLVHVTTYGICAASGELGPKRRRGDMQVPEGFYTLTEYSPVTPYYLAMQVSYPNLSDRILGERDPGDQIMIHGRCVSIGCLAMTDERIQEIWMATTALRFAGGVVHVHLYPTRDMAGLLATPAGDPHRAFWENLKEGLVAFEKQRRIPSIRIDRDGRYRFH